MLPHVEFACGSRVKGRERGGEGGREKERERERGRERASERASERERERTQTRAEGREATQRGASVSECRGSLSGRGTAGGKIVEELTKNCGRVDKRLWKS